MSKNWFRLGAALLAGGLLTVGVAACGDDGDSDDSSGSMPEVRAGGAESPVPLDPGKGEDIGLVFQAFPDPMQEGGEEQDAPANTPEQFLSTEPSVDRVDRPDHGQAVLTFTNDLSKAYFYLEVADVDLAAMNMLHLHCGLPGQLGPIIVDFSLVDPIEDIAAALEDGGTYMAEITDQLIVDTAQAGGDQQSMVDAFTLGCPIVPVLDSNQIVTVGGLGVVTNATELYVNLHTTAQTYFGDIRGQFYPAELEE